jgi:hypothetical protein
MRRDLFRFSSARHFSTLSALAAGATSGA